MLAFWWISYFGTLLLGIFFSEYITRYLFLMLTISVGVPFAVTYYLCLTNQAVPDDFNSLAANFLIYAFVAVFYADDTREFFILCVAVFIALGFQSYRPNWLYESIKELLGKKE